MACSFTPAGLNSKKKKRSSGRRRGVHFKCHEKMSVVEDSPSDSGQGTTTPLFAISDDVFGNVFAYLQPQHQAALRSTCHRSVKAFNVAVYNENFISSKVGFVCSESAPTRIASLQFDQCCHWAPLKVRRKGGGEYSHSDTTSLIMSINSSDLPWSIPDSFYEGYPVAALQLTLPPPPAAHLSQPVTAIGDQFLWQCRRLATIDLGNALIKVKSIGTGFMWGCSALESIDCTGWSALTETGYGFMVDCQSLTSITLDGWTRLTTLGSLFLSGCQSLSSIDLSGLTSLTCIGSAFMRGCSSLTSANLSGLSEVKSISTSFLANCSSLTTINLSGMTALTGIGELQVVTDGFMEGCTSLTAVDLSGLDKLWRIGARFLSGCTVLNSVDFTGTNELSAIGQEFLKDCPKTCQLIGGSYQVQHEAKRRGPGPVATIIKPFKKLWKRGR